MNFNDLVNRSQLIGEGNVSPYEVKNPVFKDITKRLKAAGASSPPRDTMLVIINVLKRLEIIGQEEVAQWESIKGSSTLPRKNALLEFIDLYKEDIIRRAEEVRETIEDELPAFFKRAGTNRGAARGPSRGETKYAANQAAEEMKAQARELRAQAKKQSKDPKAIKAVEVVASGIDSSVEKTAAAANKIKWMIPVTLAIDKIRRNLGEEGVDIDENALLEVEDYIFSEINTLDELKNYLLDIASDEDSDPSYWRIAGYIQNAIKNIKPVSSKSEDEEYNASKADVNNNGTTEPWEKGLAKNRGFTESTTAEYLTEQVKKDKYNKASTEASLSFTEKFKPKTSWQLQELRNYGL